MQSDNSVKATNSLKATGPRTYGELLQGLLVCGVFGGLTGWLTYYMVLKEMRDTTGNEDLGMPIFFCGLITLFCLLLVVSAVVALLRKLTSTEDPMSIENIPEPINLDDEPEAYGRRTGENVSTTTQRFATTSSQDDSESMESIMATAKKYEDMERSGLVSEETGQPIKTKFEGVDSEKRNLPPLRKRLLAYIIGVLVVLAYFAFQIWWHER